MNTTIEDQLAAYGDVIDDAVNSPHDNRPRDRSGSYSQSRRARTLIGAGAAATVIVTTAVVAVSLRDSNATAWADWTPTTQDADPSVVAALDTACRADVRIGPSSQALGFDVRGEGGVAIYDNDDTWAACQATLQDGHASVSGVITNSAADLDTARNWVTSGQPVVTIALQWQGDPSASLIWGVRDPSVDHIAVTTSNGDVDATLLDDLWLAWWPTNDAETAVVRAEADDRIVVNELAGQLAAPQPALATIAAAVEADGTTLERAAFADGVITWDEMNSALDAWHDCVVAAGHDMTINIDNPSETYTVSTPEVSIPADQGSPYDAGAAELLAPIEAAIDQCRTTHMSQTESAFVQQ